MYYLSTVDTSNEDFIKKKPSPQLLPRLAVVECPIFNLSIGAVERKVGPKKGRPCHVSCSGDQSQAEEILQKSRLAQSWHCAWRCPPCASHNKFGTLPDGKMLMEAERVLNWPSSNPVGWEILGFGRLPVLRTRGCKKSRLGQWLGQWPHDVEGGAARSARGGRRGRAPLKTFLLMIFYDC